MKFRRPSKRVILPAVCVAVVLVGGIYTWQSLSTWRDYEARLKNEQAEYSRLKQTALNGDTTSKRLSAVRSLDNTLAERSDLCYMNPLYSWQSAVVPVLKNGMKQCTDKVKQLSRVAAPLSELRDYLDSAEQVKKVVAQLVPSETFNEKNWATNGLQQAQDVQSQVEKLGGTGDVKKLNDEAKQHADALVTAWEGLVKANEAKDKAAFVTASAAVLKAYADFAGLADTADEAISQKVTAVTDAASSL